MEELVKDIKQDLISKNLKFVVKNEVFGKCFKVRHVNGQW